MSEIPEEKINHNELPQNPEEKELDIEAQIDRAENEGLRIAQVDAAIGTKHVEQGGGTESEIGHAEKAGEELVAGVRKLGDTIFLINQEDLTREEEERLGIEPYNSKEAKYQKDAVALTAEQIKDLAEMRKKKSEEAHEETGSPSLERKSTSEEPPSERPEMETESEKFSPKTEPTPEPPKQQGELRYAERFARITEKKKRDKFEADEKAQREAKEESERKAEKQVTDARENSERIKREAKEKIEAEREAREEGERETKKKAKREANEKAAADSVEQARLSKLTPMEKFLEADEKTKREAGKEHETDRKKHWASLTPKQRLEYSSQSFKNSAFGEEQETLKPKETAFDRFTEKVYEKIVLPFLYFKNRGWKRPFSFGFSGMETRGSSEKEERKYEEMIGQGNAEFVKDEPYAKESLYTSARLSDFYKKHYTDDATERKYHFRLVGDYKEDGTFAGTARLYKIYE